MPESVDELRIFLAGGRKIIETQKLAAIVDLLNEKRDSEVGKQSQVFLSSN